MFGILIRGTIDGKNVGVDGKWFVTKIL
jgi:hypothetical protein